MSYVKDHFKEETLLPYQKELLEWKGKGFDNRTHIIDHKTGQLLREQHYRYVVSETGNYYVRDGKMYSEQGVLLDKTQTKGQTK